MVRRVTILAALALAVGIGYSSWAFSKAEPKQKVDKVEDQKEDAAANRTPPGLKKGVKVSVHYSGREDETWVVKEVKGNWVRIGYDDKDYWANFDNVIYYSFKD